MRLDKHVCKCKEGCVVYSNQTAFSVKGDKTTYQLQNPAKKQINKYIIDDCVLANLENDKKCDYLFLVENNKHRDGYFIELKGSDVPRAIKQINNSINLLRSNIEGNIYGRIICTKFPKAPDTKSSQAYLQLMKLVGGKLMIRSQQLTESI